MPLGMRPAWDDTPLRKRPPALRGLRMENNEPWARDETVYNHRFAMWSEMDGHFNLKERYEYATVRVTELEQRKTAYVGRWNNKFEQIAGKLQAHDGNPFT